MTERKVQKLKITILTVGKLKESYWKQAIAEYSKRLGLYTKLELVEVEDEKTLDQASDLLCEQIKDKEGDRLLAHLVFVIGGSLGLSKKVLARADEKLSFSALTFPHQMMRVILLEQIYRCFRIQKNEPYHK